jgi:NADH dehydrogenase
VTPQHDVVTGAYGYTGRYLARRLLEQGRSVSTLTANPSRPDLFGGRVDAHPFSFDDPGRLADTLRGSDTLYNTYWVRFPHRDVGYERAVENSRVLFAAAREAGVRRIVHLSVTKADEGSPLPYFRWKAVLERELRESGTSFAIVRPTLVFGREDILVNNIAWILRRLPVFVVPGSGRYRLQPVSVEDVARLCVEIGSREDDVVLDAAGPETYTFDEFVQVVRDAVESRARIVHAPRGLAYALGSLIGRTVRDVLVTRDELEGLMTNLLVSDEPPTAETSFRSWVAAHGSELGRSYASELARHFRR